MSTTNQKQPLDLKLLISLCFEFILNFKTKKKKKNYFEPQNSWLINHLSFSFQIFQYYLPFFPIVATKN